MVTDWWTDNGVGSESTTDPVNHAIRFDKQLLMLMLSQKSCAGLKFYFCKRSDNDKQSLVVVGMDKGGKDLGVPASAPAGTKTIFGLGTVVTGLEPTMIAEIGGADGPPKK